MQNIIIIEVILKLNFDKSTVEINEIGNPLTKPFFKLRLDRFI